MGAVVRLDGWEERLARLVDDADKRAYRLGEHDCFRFACDTVQALTGREVWSQWAGRYSRRAECVRLIRGVAVDLRAAVAAVLGVEPIPVAMAGRGDIYLFEDGLPHLAVGLGSQVLVLLPVGLGIIRPNDPRLTAAWRVE